MKAKPFLLSLLAAGLALVTGPAPAQEPFAKLVGDVPVGEVQKGDALSVPYILWGGDVATFLANGGLETRPTSLFHGQGLNLKLTPGDDFPGQVKNYLSGKTPFLRGTLSMLGQASEVIGKDPRTRPVVFLQLTWSAGDHLVARPNCQTLNDLKGKKIALQKFGPHAGMLGDVLRTARLKWSDITPVWTDDVTGPKGPAELFRKDAGVDACFAISPDMLALTGGLDKTGTGDKGTVKDAHVLVSTVQMKHSIADVYACRKDFFDTHKELVEKFAAGYLKASEELTDLRKQAQDKNAGAAAKYKAILQTAMRIYGKEALPSEDDADGLVGDAVFVGLPGNVSFFTDKGNLSGFDAKQKAALDLAVTLGNAKTAIEFLKPDFNYEEVRRLGGLKVLTVGKTTGIESGGGVIVNFTISFGAEQTEFDEVRYAQDFQDALDQASLFANAVMVIRGHADLSKLLSDFVRAGLEKGNLRREGFKGHYQYYWDGDKLDLGDTKKVIDLINKTDWTEAKQDPKGTLQALQKLSKDRADSVKEAVLNYAKLRGIRLEPSQFKAEGAGIREPVAPQPRTDEEMARNRRVEFRLEKRSIETSSGGTIDY
ncbi:MAG TPA: ABC transporter substrate-binding protein [Gemmataceae bacterium]|nr:ABC transporter substrate-binding protein [Gemmataceae bacterium]